MFERHTSRADNWPARYTTSSEAPRNRLLTSSHTGPIQVRDFQANFHVSTTFLAFVPDHFATCRAMISIRSSMSWSFRSTRFRLRQHLHLLALIWPERLLLGSRLERVPRCELLNTYFNGETKDGEFDADLPVAGPHHRVVRVEREAALAAGGDPLEPGFYVELATGLNRFDADAGVWVPARAEFEQTPDGHVVARQTQHQVILAPNLQTEDAVDFLTADGVRLRSTILGLGVLDTATGSSFLLAEVQASAPVLVSPTEVVYPEAFDGVRADVRYRLGLDRFEQDLIFREQIAPEWLEKLGVNPLTARVFVMTEFFDPPEGGYGIGSYCAAPSRVDAFCRETSARIHTVSLSNEGLNHSGSLHLQTLEISALFRDREKPKAGFLSPPRRRLRINL